MFIGEQPNGRVTEIELRDVEFLEEDFPNKGEVDKDMELDKMEDPYVGTPSRLVKNKEKIPHSHRDSRSDLPPLGLVPMDVDSQDLQ